MIPKIDQLNESTIQEFEKNINILFETSPPLSRDLFAARPFTSYTELIEKASGIITAMTMDDKIITVNAHPRIGAPTQSLSSLSKKEQGAAEPNLEKTLERLACLNKEYEDKYGFKFVVFVNGRPRSEIVAVLEKRLQSTSREVELQTGLDAMISIAFDRLKKLGFE